MRVGVSMLLLLMKWSSGSRKGKGEGGSEGAPSVGGMHEGRHL